MDAIVYDCLIYLGVAFGLASAALTIACFAGRNGWPRNRLFFAAVTSLALCSTAVVCIVWSIVIDVQEGDWQSLIDTVPYWAVCFTGLVGFNVIAGLLSLTSQQTKTRR